MKGKRQEIILEIIKENAILTQDDLQNALKSRGYNVTQSTVSRDIKELCLVKGHDDNGRYRYIVNNNQTADKQFLSHYNDIIYRSVISIDSAVNDIVIKCYNGMASSVCVAIDALYNNKMLGTIAGDDTIFIVTRSEREAKELAFEIKEICEG